MNIPAKGVFIAYARLTLFSEEESIPDIMYTFSFTNHEQFQYCCLKLTICDCAHSDDFTNITCLNSP